MLESAKEVSMKEGKNKKEKAMKANRFFMQPTPKQQRLT